MRKNTCKSKSKIFGRASFRVQDFLFSRRLSCREQLKKQEEMVMRQEEMRRKTAAYEAELRTKTEVAKAKAEAAGRIQQERDNHDLILERVKLEAAERRSTILQAIQDGSVQLGKGISEYLNNTTELRNTALTITAMAVGIYTARTTVTITGRYIETKLGKPSLVRETSRFTLSQFAREPQKFVSKWFGRWSSSAPADGPVGALRGMVLNEPLKQQLSSLAVSTMNTKANHAFL
jgi:ATPase family AAA domain-containing protein 3A/B